MRLIERIARLRLALHGHYPGARTDEAALASLVKTLAPGLAAVEAGAGHLALWPRRGALRMALVTWPARQAWHGEPADHVWVQYRPGDAEAARQACAALDALPPLPHFDLHLDVLLPEVRRHLLARGFGIDSVTLMGRPAAALARLGTPRPLPPSLRITPLEPALIPAVVELQRDAFATQPQYCSFGANPLWLASLTQSLTDAPPGRRDVLVEGDRVVGYWGTDFDLDNPLWGRKAGMVLVLVPAWQGKGLARFAYHRLLSAQVEAHIDVFRGGTSQPPVMRLASQIGRWPHATWIRPRAKTFFDPAYFDALLALPMPTDPLAG